MIGQRYPRGRGQAFAGLALCLCIAACDGADGPRGPSAATRGEEAALKDAAAMLDEREPAEIPPESPADEARGG